MSANPRVAIVYLSFHCEPYLPDVIAALKQITYPKDRVEFVIVDNPHPVHGNSVRYIEDTLMPLSGNEVPHVTLLPQRENTGFAGGNNIGIQWALEHGFDYVYLHNNDGFVAADFLEPLVSAMEKDKTIGAAQSLVMLHPETDLVNTSGNAYHYLGIGYCNNFRARRSELDLPPVADTSYASGAAILLRADLLKQYGLWDKDFFMYHEDIEYSFRLRLAGYRIITVRDSIFYHKYAFSRMAEKFYYIERNRFGVLLMFYRWPTLLLIAPMGLLLELGLLLFAWRGGWLKAKLRAYGYWCQAQHWRLWWGKRRRTQKLRAISDRALLKTAVGQVTFNETTIQHPMLKYVGNPLMAAYWWIVKRLLFW